MAFSRPQYGCRLPSYREKNNEHCRTLCCLTCFSNPKRKHNSRLFTLVFMFKLLKLKQAWYFRYVMMFLVNASKVFKITNRNGKMDSYVVRVNEFPVMD